MIYKKGVVMKLTKLIIERKEPWTSFREKEKEPYYSGEICFSGKSGDIKCKLDKNVSSKFLMMASDIVLDTARKAQDDLVTEIEKAISAAVSSSVALEFKEGEVDDSVLIITEPIEIDSNGCVKAVGGGEHPDKERILKYSKECYLREHGLFLKEAIMDMPPGYVKVADESK